MQKGELDLQEEQLIKKLQELEKKHDKDGVINDYANELRDQVEGDIKKRKEMRENIRNIHPLKKKIEKKPEKLKKDIEKNRKNIDSQNFYSPFEKEPVSDSFNNKLDNKEGKMIKSEYEPISLESENFDENHNNHEFMSGPFQRNVNESDETTKNKSEYETISLESENFDGNHNSHEYTEKINSTFRENLNQLQERKNPIQNLEIKPILPKPVNIETDKIENNLENIDAKKKVHKVPHEKDYIKKSINTKEESALENEIKQCSELIRLLKKEIWKVVTGQEEVINGLIRAFICDGHVLLEGAPGIAKTLVIKALGEASGCSVKRIQFTVDLLPTDIIGITSYTPGKGFEIIKGPIFANFIIADEINRSPPKTQSALIEAMQEKQVTIGKTIFPLPKPYFVMATKNPLESTGVYTLPEAQMDRFLFNIIMGYPKENEEKKIMEENTTLKRFEEYNLRPVITPEQIVRMQEIVKKIYLSDHVKSYIISIVAKTRDKNFKYSDCIAYGASPRASIAMFIASKARALMEGRSYVIPEDVKEVINDILRHRLIITYKATVRGLNVEDLIKAILEEAKV